MIRKDSEEESSHQTFHVRLKPAPAVLLRTTVQVHDRLEVSESAQSAGIAHHGLYRRVSQKLIGEIGSELGKVQEGSDRHARLTEILTVARSAAIITPDDLQKVPVPDVSCY